MGAARKLDLDHRLEAYFATLRSSSFLKDTLKRRVENWQLYAAVTGSAVAMMTSASVSIIGSEIRDTTTEPPAGVAAVKPDFASSRTMPMVRAVKASMARHASQAQSPSISPAGVVPLYGTVNTIQPGEWVSIYGSGLASGDATWNGDFPILLGGTSVTINGKETAYYLEFVSPGQINLQAPDDTATGTVDVLVTTGSGSATSTVTLSEFAPSFNLLDAKHVSGIILRSNGSGALARQGKPTSILGPTGEFLRLSRKTVAAQAGDTVELFRRWLRADYTRRPGWKSVLRRGAG